MLVGDKMTRNVVTVSPETTVADGLRLMNERGIHRLPVVEAGRRLVGIVSDMDLRIAEAAGRLSDPVSAVMTRRVITVDEYDTLEYAATLMREKGVGGLPVLRGERLVGIITDGDVFDVFADLMGVGKPGVRLTLALPAEQGTIVELLQTVHRQGGTIIALGTVKLDTRHLMVLKVGNLTPEKAQQAVSLAGVELVDMLAEQR
jgi:acetoin utilization protein AcuB